MSRRAQGYFTALYGCYQSILRLLDGHYNREQPQVQTSARNAQEAWAKEGHIIKEAGGFWGLVPLSGGS